MRYRFDRFTFDPSRGLFRDDEAIPLEPRALDLLHYFLNENERIISREELCDALWDGKIVSDAAISTQIRSIRKALHDDREQQRFIKTYPRRGFSFVAPVKVDEAPQTLEDRIAISRAERPASGDNRAGRTAIPAGLGRYTAIAAAIALAIVAYVFWQDSSSEVAGVAKPPGPSIAVLPFDNLSGDESKTYLADAFTEDLITDLSRIRDAFVISRSTSFTYRDKNVGASQVAADLGVRYVLEGSVRLEGDRVRVNAQLIDGENDSHLWSERYDRPVADLFELQGNVTGQIASVLRAELRKADLDRQDPELMDNAWDYALRGNVLLYNHQSVTDYQEAYALLTKATELDPGIASAWGGLAFVHLVGSLANVPGVSRADSAQLSLETALKATQADPMNAEPYWLVGAGYARMGQPELGMPACRTAMDLNPNLDCGYVCAGLVHMASDEPEKAIPYFEYALELNPRFRPFTKEKYLGLAHIQSNQNDLAIAALERALATAPQDSFANLAMASALALDGRVEAASELLDRYFSGTGASRPSVESLRSSLGWMGAGTEDMLRGLSEAGL
ncbi:Transcriptional activator CadC [Ruegeria denitrificans]|uniref:Transcriptional activator CadC n=1 Tax=Ruegeria denitrificans TaxID=1715692 RepID=A0A0P1IAU6_9RHOB|nr:winged helix-turn-helix domain-containing protein [Ruegeria denitrificans]CUK01990.1 Transcriptional activator CadC [Ruegeria denitrificans]